MSVNCKNFYAGLIGLRNCNELKMCDKILKILFIHQEKKMVRNQLKEKNILSLLSNFIEYVSHFNHSLLNRFK